MLKTVGRGARLHLDNCRARTSIKDGFAAPCMNCNAVKVLLHLYRLFAASVLFFRLFSNLCFFLTV